MAAKITIKDYPLKSVALGDTIVIAGLTCTVGPCYLNLEAPESSAKAKKGNGVIGDVLKLNSQARDILSRRLFGTGSERGEDFLEWPVGDFSLATALINALYERSMTLGLDADKVKVEVIRYKDHTVFKVGDRILTVVGHPLYSITEKPQEDVVHVDEGVATSQ